MISVIFYSWQADLPSSTNRGFIQDALERAITAIKKNLSEETINIEPVMDRDTINIVGSPDIASTIFRKIDESYIFVCDISFINQETEGKRTPNPNVLIELGYAIKTLGWERIIMVLNTNSGATEKLPFDIKTRRIIKYEPFKEAQKQPNEPNKAKERLKNALQRQIEPLLKQAHQTGPYIIRIPSLASDRLKRVAHNLEDPNPNKREESFPSLIDLASSDAIARGLLTQLLEHPYSDLQVWAALELARYKNEKAIPTLIKNIHGIPMDSFNPFANVKFSDSITKALISFDKTAVPFLCEALQNEGDEFRLSKFADLLGQIGEHEAVPYLLNAFYKGSFSEWWNRNSFINAIVKMKDPSVVEALIEIIQSELEIPTYLTVLHALGEFASVEALPYFLKALQYKQDSSVRQSAAEALGKLKDPTSLSELLEALYDDDKNVRIEVVKALGHFADPSAIKAITEVLYNEDTDTQIVAAETLGKTENPSLAPILIQALEKSESYLKVTLVRALGSLKNQDAIPHLINLLNDTTTIPTSWNQFIYIGQEAANALEKIGTPEAINIARHWKRKFRAQANNTLSSDT